MIQEKRKEGYNSDFSGHHYSGNTFDHASNQRIGNIHLFL